MNDKIKYYEMNYKEIDNYVNKFNELIKEYNQNGVKRLLKVLFWSFIFTVCFCAAMVGLMYIFKPTDKQLEKICLYFIFGIPAILYIIARTYQFIYTKKNKGRTILNIPISATQNDIELKLNHVLSILRYSEKKYHGEKVYFAKRQIVFKEALPSKYNRYIKYTIKNNTLQIEAWIYGELPIDYKYWGRKIKMISLYELREIVYYILNY